MHDKKQVADPRNLLNIVRYIRPEWFAFVLGLAFLFVCDGLQFLIPQILRYAVDALAQGAATGRVLLVAAGGILAIAAVVGTCRFLWRYFIVGASIRIDRKIRDDLLSHLLRLPQSYFQNASTGDLMARATNDIRFVQMAAGIGTVILIDTFVMGLGTLIIMICMSAWLTLFSLGPLVLIAVMVLLFDPAIRRRYEKVQRTFSELTERLRENIAGIRVVKAYVQEKEEIDNFAGVSEKYVRKNIRLVRIWGALFPMIMVFMGLAMAVTLLFGGRMVILGRISIGEFVAFTAYLGMLSWPMMAIGWVVSIFQRGTVSMGRIQEILDQEPVRETPLDPLPELAPVRGALAVHNLSFAFEPEGEPVLKGISFELPQGGKLGIVGRVGSGKSTLLSLLMRLWEPPPGTVFVDGMDVTRIPLAELRRRFAWVPQESFLFSDTLAENIAFGRPSAPLEEVRAAAKVSKIHEAIESFPEGYETRVGERGVTLSGGERQRTSIARAWLTEAPVLLFDDCLSAVDAETEQRIIRELVEATEGKTCVIVSHRVSAVEWADEIIVLEEGAVAERGTHDMLRKGSGLYAEMVFRQQAEMKIESLRGAEKREES